MKTNAIKFQIGKFGVSPGAVDSLRLALKNHKMVRISVLKSSGRDRESIKTMADEIVSKLPEHGCTYRIIGFTIILRKHPVQKSHVKRMPKVKSRR